MGAVRDLAEIKACLAAMGVTLAGSAERLYPGDQAQDEGSGSCAGG